MAEGGRSLRDPQRLNRDLLKLPYGQRQMRQGIDVLGLGGPTLCEVHGDIFGRRVQSIESIPQLVPRPPRHDHLVTSDPTPLPQCLRLVVALAMTPPTVQTRPARPGRSRERRPAPNTLRLTFRHSDRT